MITRDTTANWIELNGVTSFSDWTFSGPGGVPVELSRFEAVVEEADNKQISNHQCPNISQRESIVEQDAGIQVDSGFAKVPVKWGFSGIS